MVLETFFEHGSSSDEHMRDSVFFPLSWGAYITSHLVVLHVHIQNSGAGKKRKKNNRKTKTIQKEQLVVAAHSSKLDRGK